MYKFYNIIKIMFEIIITIKWNVNVSVFILIKLSLKGVKQNKGLNDEYSHTQLLFREKNAEV